MTQPKLQSEFWHKALTIAVTVMVVVTGLMIASNLRLTSQQQKTEIALAVLSESVLTHNINASKYILQIEDHEVRLVKLESQEHPSTKDRITKEEVLDLVERLREYVEKNYERK